MHPASPKKEPKTPPKNWQSLFLAALGETSNVTAAAHAAQISPSRAYKARRTDPDFKRRWMAALCEGYDNLEMDLLCWLRTGKVESLLEQNGNIEEPKAASEPAATAESGKKAGKSAKSAQPAARTASAVWSMVRWVASSACRAAPPAAQWHRGAAIWWVNAARNCSSPPAPDGSMHRRQGQAPHAT
jgi:hypothetical protein